MRLHPGGFRETFGGFSFLALGDVCLASGDRGAPDRSLSASLVSSKELSTKAPCLRLFGAKSRNRTPYPMIK